MRIRAGRYVSFVSLGRRVERSITNSEEVAASYWCGRCPSIPSGERPVAPRCSRGHRECSCPTILSLVLFTPQGEEGKRVQEMLFDELWRETMRQLRSVKVRGVSPSEARVAEDS